MRNLPVQGAIDNETRCKHYHSEKDRIALKFHCCGNYFSCYKCHAEHGCGNVSVWPKATFDEKAVLCGNCQTEMSIQAYLNCKAACPHCGAPFNSGCSLHHHLYFDVSPAE